MASFMGNGVAAAAAVSPKVDELAPPSNGLTADQQRLYRIEFSISVLQET